jgi:protein TonB
LTDSKYTFVIQSVLVHGGLALALGSLFWLAPTPRPAVTKYKIEIENIKMAEPVTATAPKVNLAKPKSQDQNLIKPKKQVFGITKDTLTSENETAPGVKLGTTLAKAEDNEIIDRNEAFDLPTPTAEYLVSEMPRIQSEVRIPYPAEAKKKNKEGLVLMDLLIDEKGQVRQAVLIEGPGFGLNEAALVAIRDFKFYPAKLDGKSVAVRIRYAYRFVLN